MAIRQIPPPRRHIPDNQSEFGNNGQSEELMRNWARQLGNVPGGVSSGVSLALFLWVANNRLFGCNPLFYPRTRVGYIPLEPQYTTRFRNEIYWCDALPSFRETQLWR